MNRDDMLARNAKCHMSFIKINVMFWLFIRLCVWTVDIVIESVRNGIYFIFLNIFCFFFGHLSHLKRTIKYQLICKTFENIVPFFQNSYDEERAFILLWSIFHIFSRLYYQTIKIFVFFLLQVGKIHFKARK